MSAGMVNAYLLAKNLSITFEVAGFESDVICSSH